MASDLAPGDQLAAGLDEVFVAAVAAMAGAPERVVLSDVVTKINKRNKPQDRVFVLTESAYYNVLPTKDAAGRTAAGTIKRRIAFEALGSVSVSELGDELVMHVPEEYDYHFSTPRRAQVLSTLERNYKRMLFRDLVVHSRPGRELAPFVETKEVKKTLKAKGKLTLVDGTYGMPKDEDVGGGAASGAGAGGEEETPEDELEDELASYTRTGRAMTTGWGKEETDVTLDSFDLLKVIGRGSFGKVMQVRHKGDGQIYAMKILRKKELLERNQVEHTQAERRILEEMDHPFLVKLRFAFQTPAKLYMVLDYLNGGELFFHLKTSRKFTEDRARFYGAEIAMAMGHLHGKDMIYRDLKPENILLDHEGHVRLTDFGLAKTSVKGQSANTFCGTPEYLAPEVILDNGHGKEVDWWSLGIVLWEMMCGLPPFYSTNVQKMYKDITAAPLRRHRVLSDEAWDLMQKLLDRNPETRLGSGEADVEALRAHPWFARLDWDALFRKEVTPPFKPKVRGVADTSNVDKEFTSEAVQDSVVPTSALTSGSDFSGFTYAERSAMDAK